MKRYQTLSLKYKGYAILSIICLFILGVLAALSIYTVVAWNGPYAWLIRGLYQYAYAAASFLPVIVFFLQWGYHTDGRYDMSAVYSDSWGELHDTVLKLAIFALANLTFDARAVYDEANAMALIEQHRLELSISICVYMVLSVTAFIIQEARYKPTPPNLLTLPQGH